MQSTPPQIIIKYSKTKFIWFGAMVLVALGGIIELFSADGIAAYIMAIACMLVGGILGYIEVGYLRVIDQPQLIINIEGLQFTDTVFYPWPSISNEQVKQHGSPKPDYVLTFMVDGNQHVIRLNGLERSPQEISDALISYRIYHNTLKVV